MSVQMAAPGVGFVTLYANVFLLNSPQGRVLVDTGTMQHTLAFWQLLQTFQPNAVLITHSHLDHDGNAFLAARLGYPVLAHPLEFERLTGGSHELPYPAGQPRLGELLSRLHPKVPLPALTPVEADAEVLGWQVIHLPGHTDGQIGLLRNGVLVAADAVVASANGAHLPRPVYNWNHELALKTLKSMADMELQLVLPGHGEPLTPQQVRARAVRDD